MAFIPVANTAQCKIKYTYAGQGIMNNVYFEKATAWDVASLQDLADELWDRWATEVLIDLADGLTITEVEALDLTAATAPVARHIQSLSGSVSTGNLPNNVAFAIKFTTALRGRSFRGRIYLPGISLSSEQNSGFLLLAAADNLLGDVEGALVGTATTLSVAHVVVSRYSGVDVNGDPIPRIAGVTEPVTAYSYSDLAFDSQRRRLPGRGQ